MNILFDGKYLSGQKTGLGFYSYNVLKNFKSRRILIISPYKIDSQNSNFEYKFFFKKKFFLSGFIYDEIILPFYILKLKKFINVSGKLPILSVFFSGNILVNSVVYDFNYKFNRNFFPNYWTYILRYIGQTLSVKKSKKLLCISKNTLIDLRRFYNKWGKYYKTGSTINSPIKKNLVKKNTLLFVGTLEPRKNIEMLIDYFNKIDGYKLNIVGKKGWNYKNIIDKINSNKNIIYHNYVSDRKLISLYESSEIFIFPSIYEGFGLPLADALHFGMPIFALDTDINREVLETNANYFLTFEEFKNCFNSVKKYPQSNKDNQEENWFKISEYLSSFSKNK
tara:strand:+ start:296 stop:1306 length:1011 start_codon:yes stop_codon:yes gene_type:complete